MSTNKSIYEKFIIESADRSKTADISEGVIAFTYFENIFSPYLTARVIVSNTAGSIVGEDGKKHNPVMIHRAILGSFERFLGILIENYSGKLPLWLAPKQIAVLTVTDEVIPFAEKLSTQLLAEGIRVELDKRNEKIGYKIREHSNSKTQLMAIVGKKEMENEEVSIRTLADSETETMSVKETIKKLKKLVLSP